MARTCNLIFIVLDVLKPLGDKRIIESELEGFGIRLNKKPPNITVRRKDKGGIAITNTVPLTNIDHDEIKAVLSEYKMSNADVAIRQAGVTADDVVDVIEGNRYASRASVSCAFHAHLSTEYTSQPYTCVSFPSMMVAGCACSTASIRSSTKSTPSQSRS